MSFDVQFGEKDTSFETTFSETTKVPVAVGGTNNYDELENKPKINSVELSGNLTLDELEIQPKGDYVTNNTLDTELEELVETFNRGMTTKQDKLVSGTNIKTINNQSILGEGNIEIETSQEETDPIYQAEKPTLALKTELPVKLGDLENDVGYITNYIETDPTVPEHVKEISEQDIINWNNKSDFSGSYNDLTNKPTIPTDNSELTNGANYQNANQVQTAINEALGGITGITYSVVVELPSTGETGVIYLINNNGENPNIYDEYIYVNNSFEKIGTTEVDLTNYVTKGELPTVIPYKASYTDEEKANYGEEIFACFDSTYTMLKPLFISVSGLLLPYTGRINDSTLSFGLAITDVTNGVHYVDYSMEIDTTSQTLQSITAEPTIELVDDEELSEKQDKLISGTNIKTINGNSILGNGNIDLEIVKVLEASSTNIIDFNTLTEPGYYLIKNANTSTTTNSPITDTGTYDIPLEVEKTILASGGTDYEQLVEGGIVYRKYTNGEWYDWGNVTDDMYQMSKAYTDSSSNSILTQAKSYTDSAIGGALSGSY